MVNPALALTIVLFGITQQLSTALVVPTLVVESIGYGRARGDYHPGVPDAARGLSRGRPDVAAGRR